MLTLRFFLSVSIILLSLNEAVQAQPAAAPQVRRLGHLTASVSVIYTAFDNKPIVDAIFTTDNRAKFNARCLNAYRDIQYVLRDSSGNAIPIDVDAWKTQFDGMTQQDSVPCEDAPWPQKESRAFLQALFPSAPHGTYTLTMTLAPRGMLATAEFAPIMVVF